MRSGSFDGMPWLQFGKGPELVLVIPGIDDSVHQFHWLPRAWAWFFAPLARGRRVMLLSRPRGLAETTSIEALADQYAAVIERHFGAVHVVGISMGGLIAQQLAARHPHLVRRLALVVTAHHVGYAGCDHGERLARLGGAGRWAAFFSHFGDICFTGRHRWLMRASGWLFVAGRYARRDSPAGDFAISARACANHDGAPLLARITAPTLVWAAREDCLFPAELVEQMAAALPNATLQLVDGPHGAFLQQRSAFCRNIQDFLFDAIGQNETDDSNVGIKMTA